jgi:hypothetical protein
MKLHLITILVVATVLSILYFLLISPTIMSFILLVGIISLGTWALIKFYKFVYATVKNLVGNE